MKYIFFILVIALSSTLVQSFLFSLLKSLIKHDDKDKACVKTPSCGKASCYRTIDGSCNNVNQPSIGMAGLPYGRLCRASYSDGKCAFPKAKSGKPLPNARKISFKFSPEKNRNDTKYTVLLQQWGQFVTHDVVVTAGVPQTHKYLVSCCNRDKNFLTKALSDPRCAPITIPKDDPDFYEDGKICLQTARTLNTRDKDCKSSNYDVTPISNVTAWLDLSQIYGSTREICENLRESKGGRLEYVYRNGQSWPPQDSQSSCPGQKKSDPCYMTGDFRGNQNPHLTVLQIIFFREHNRLCKELSILNKHWHDERLFQEARRILIAAYQHITYYSYIPIIIGYDKAVDDNVIYPGRSGYVNTYDDEVDPSILVEHASAAFRFFHSNIFGKLVFYTEDREPCGHINMEDYFNEPGFLENDSNFDNLARGMTTQPMRCSDQYFDTAVTLFMFKGAEKYGLDLRASDIQRGRDHGICSYVNARKFFGLPVPKDFCDLLDYGISEENVDQLRDFYGDVSDVDLIVGGTLEPLVKGSQCGITFQNIITAQWLRTRRGDSLFYEDGTNEDIALSLDQLRAIRSGASISRILCDNVKSIKNMQPNAFVQISKDNKVVSCDELPSIDLKYWKETNSDC